MPSPGRLSMSYDSWLGWPVLMAFTYRYNAAMGLWLQLLNTSKTGRLTDVRCKHAHNIQSQPAHIARNWRLDRLSTQGQQDVFACELPFAAIGLRHLNCVPIK